MESSGELPKMGRFKKSWLLTQSAWRGLRLDKELVALPVMGMLINLLILAFVFVIGVATSSADVFFSTSTAGYESGFNMTVLGYLAFIAVGLMMAAVSTFVSGAVIHGALERFRGNDPTVRSSLQAAWRRLGPLTAFAAFSYTVGFIISEIAERLPLVGGMVVNWLAGAAWGVASFFALPVIMSEQQAVGPVKATKASIGIIKKVWGESLIANISIGIIAALTVLVYALLSGLLVVGLATAGIGTLWMLALGVLLILGILFIGLVFGVMSSFVKAAIYHFAITGESPATFNRQMLRQAFTPKKARKVFGA